MVDPGPDVESAYLHLAQRTHQGRYWSHSLLQLFHWSQIHAPPSDYDALVYGFVPLSTAVAYAVLPLRAGLFCAH